MIRLIIEAIVVGCVVVLMGYPSSLLALKILPMNDDDHRSVMYISLFLTGVFSHLLFEILKMNSIRGTARMDSLAQTGRASPCTRRARVRRAEATGHYRKIITDLYPVRLWGPRWGVCGEIVNTKPLPLPPPPPPLTLHPLTLIPKPYPTPTTIWTWPSTTTFLNR